MRAMSRVERFFERLVERPSARLFKTRLQPIQIFRRIERAMDAERGAVAKRGFVPDRFVVRLHPDDLAGFEPADELAANLASGALTYARARSYALRERPRVTLEPDERLRPGEAEVEASVSEAASGPAPIQTDLVDGGTSVFEVPIVRGPDAVIEVREPNRAARRIPISGAPIRIGRAPECELVLKDSLVSRRHARLAARDGVLVLTDLGSTNGTLVNGRRVSEVVLGEGDRIQVGATSLVVEAVPAGAGARS